MLTSASDQPSCLRFCVHLQGPHNPSFYYRVCVLCVCLCLCVCVCVCVCVCDLQENIKTLLKYVVERFMESLEGVDYVETFKTMKLRYEQEMDGNNKQTEASR